MIRTGIATSETIKEVLENNGTPLTYGATPESWKEALTTISGTDETITPREEDGVTGYMSTNETVLKTFNNETKGTTYTVDIIFVKNGEAVEVENPTLGTIAGVKEDDHYEFAGIEGELTDVALTFTFDGEEKTETKSYTTFTDDIVIL